MENQQIINALVDKTITQTEQIENLGLLIESMLTRITYLEKISNGKRKIK